MTLVRLNHPRLMSKLAQEAFYGNMLNDKLESNSNSNIDYRVNEEDSVVNIEFAVPGFSKSDLEIELDNQFLTVKSKERAEDDIRTGFAAFTFEKRFKVSDKMDKEKISAHTENGVLYISLPKVEAAIVKPARSIEIE